MKSIKIIIALVTLALTNSVYASLIVQIGPNGYYKESALSKFRSVDFEIRQIDYSTTGGWWAAGQNTLMNYNSSTTFTFESNILDITSYNERFVAAVLDNGEFYLAGPHGYLSNTSLSQLRNADFEVKMLDYSTTGGWWAAGDYSVLNYKNNTKHTFTQKIVDIASYDDDFLVVTLEDGKLWVAGPNGYESNRSFSKFQGLDFKLTEVDFSSAGSWWAAGDNKVINYGSGTSKVFDLPVLDITSFNRDYAVVLLDDTPQYSSQNTSLPMNLAPSLAPQVQAPTNVNEPALISFVSLFLFLLFVRRQQRISQTSTAN